MSSLGELPIGTVTFLFTDIEGSTELLKRLGGERYGDALADHQRILREVFAEHDGHEIDTQGDSFFVAFRRAKDAVSATIACQHRLTEHAWPNDAQLRVRMGIHTGEPAIGGERYVGLGVHRAARICAAGHGGQVLLSQTARELLRDDPIPDVSLRDLGEHQLKDLDEPERLYQLVTPGLQEDFAELKTFGHDPVLAGLRPPRPHTPAPREARKTVTVFFAELLDSTARAEPLDPEDVRAVLSPYYMRIRSELERLGGTVEKFIGHAVMALFGVPAAHEDDPERAVRAALAIRDWMVAEDDALHARIAVATGEAIVTLGALASEREPIAAGEVVKMAERLRGAASVSSVLVDEQTFRRTRDAIDYQEAAAIAAEAKCEPIRVWEAIRPLARPGVDLSRHRTPFVGRERELAALQERLAWAASQRSPHLVTILGVPGIGKSRLVSELQHAAAEADEPLRWRQGRSLPYGDGVSFWALGEMVKAEAGILESDPTQKVERKLREAVRLIVDDPAEAGRIATYLGALIGLSGGEATTADRRAETFAAWRHFLEALADERLLVLVFEDLHWADDALLDFVDELVDRVVGVPLLVVATARPELLDRRPGWAGGKPSALTISLSPLTQSDTTRLVAALLERPLLPAAAHEALLARTGGNPLYAEQFCRISDRARPARGYAGEPARHHRGAPGCVSGCRETAAAGRRGCRQSLLGRRARGDRWRFAPGR